MHQDSAPFEGPVLPDNLRAVFIAHAEGALAEDAKARLNLTEEAVQRGKNTARQIIYEAVKSKVEIKAKVSLLVETMGRAKEAEGTYESIVRAAMSDPKFVAEVLRRAGVEFVTRVFAYGTQLERIRYGNALAEAERRVDLELDRELRRQTDAILARAMAVTFSSAPMFPMPTAPLTFHASRGGGSIR